MATLAPYAPARRLAATPPDPAPRVNRSKSYWDMGVLLVYTSPGCAGRGAAGVVSQPLVRRVAGLRASTEARPPASLTEARGAPASSSARPDRTIRLPGRAAGDG